MKRLILFVGLTTCVAFNAFSAPVEFPTHIPLDYLPISKIRLGVTQAEVEKVLGEKIYPKVGVALIINPLYGESSTDQLMSVLDFGQQGRLVRIKAPALSGATHDESFAALSRIATPLKLDRTSVDFISVPTSLISDQYMVCLDKGSTLTLRSERYNINQQLKISWELRNQSNPRSACKHTNKNGVRLH